MSEYGHEPARGLPGVLPPDEQILWQGTPDWKLLVSTALHIRLAAAYFTAIVIWAVVTGDTATAVGVSLLGATVIGLFTAFGWGVGRTTIYTLTNKRIVLRIGVALNKCINLPLVEIDSANLKLIGPDHGNIVIALKGMPRLGYLMLWPHVRSLRFVRPQPTLRAIPDARMVAQLLLKAAQKVQAVAPAETAENAVQDRPLFGATA